MRRPSRRRVGSPRPVGALPTAMTDSALLPLSVLDLATVGTGQSTSEALAATGELARAADRLGYTRFWVAEHHNMPAVASTSPPVLIAHLAAVTDRIRVGSGGVMLPNHAPLVVAEQFALLGLFGDERVEGGLAERFTATPAAESAPSVMLLGSSGFSAQLAGALGLPFAFAHHFGGPHTVEAVQLYRDSFRPSPVLERPYAIVTANVFTAETAEEAARLALPGKLMRLAIRTNRLRPLPSPEEAAVDPERAAAESMPSNAIVGTPDVAVAGARGLT